ncbi:hypothetical protein ALMP_31000 [Streptomyces sp. A012304]|nr:hypothetical protein ALMP_31000 [Streptomyces sp. A012304]
MLLALVAVLMVAVAGSELAVADDGPISSGISGACKVTQTTSPIGIVTNIVTSGAGYDLCDKVGDSVESKVKEEWSNVWDSVLGDVVKSAADVTKWIIKKVLTVALLGPSLDLEATGLFGKDATLAGMMTWLGLVIATAGAMWQVGKMAITGQAKHVGRAMLGWMESTVLSALGVGLVALLLIAGDALTAGLVNATFEDDGKAYETIVAVMVPAAIKNPVTMLCVVLVLLLVGFIQLILVFLRQSAIPIQCLLLPVAAGGRVGGDATRQWAPRLITSILVVIAYKPILAVIICVGFAEFGTATTLAEWLRGCATLILAILAPGPLTRIFAPFGEAVGAGMAAGGIGGALGSAAGYFTGRQGKDGDADGGARPTNAVEHAAYVEQNMGRQGRGGEGGGEAGRDAQAQAQRNEAGRVPGQGGAPSEGAPTGVGGGVSGGAPGGQTGGAPGGMAGKGASTAAGGAAIGIQFLDGVNNTMQSASGQIGNGGNSQ